MYTIEIIQHKEVRHGMTLQKGTIYARGNGTNVAAKAPKGESFEVFMLNLNERTWHKAELSIHYSSLARELIEFVYTHKEVIAALTKRNPLR